MAYSGIVKPSRGVLYMVCAAAAFSTMALLVKLASARIPTGEIVLVRCLVTLAISYALVRRAGVSPWGRERGRLVLRGLLGFGALSLYYVALAVLPLADAMTIHHTTPLLTAVLAWWLLGDAIGKATLFAIACGIGGVLLIVHPSGTGLDATGVAVAVASALCAAASYVTVSQLARTEHSLVIVFYFPLVAAPLALPWALANWVTPTPVELLLLLGIGLATQVGQVFLTMALAIERAGRATSVGYLQVAFAIVLQLVVFGALPSLATIGGALLIVLGTVVVASAGRHAAAVRAIPAGTPPPPPA